eukprot:gene21531-27878_t
MFYAKSLKCLRRTINQHLCATRNLQSSAVTDCKITRITVYKVDLPLHEKSYKWSGGNYVTSFDATIVRLETSLGVVGYGENTPLGPNYLPAYAEGTRSGIKRMAPDLLGADPTKINHINYLMDKLLKGHPYVKSAIDMACWDILGKVSG